MNTRNQNAALTDNVVAISRKVSFGNPSASRKKATNGGL